MRVAPNRYTELSLLSLLALLWGSSYLLIKVALIEIPPVTLIALRWWERSLARVIYAPLSVLLLGTCLLGERLSLALAIGLAAAVLGVALINWPGRGTDT